MDQYANKYITFTRKIANNRLDVKFGLVEFKKI